MNLDFLGTSGLAAVVGLMIFAAAGIFAYIVFRILRKSIKIAFRLALAAAILAIAVIGGISLWWLNAGDVPAERPRPFRRR